MKSAPNPTQANPPANSPQSGFVALFLFVSGAVALVYEIVWQRQFALVFGSSAPATAAVLAAYFAGLGAGSLVIGRWAKRWTRPLRAYALLELSVGLGALLVSPILAGFELTYPAVYQALAGHPGLFVAARIAVAFFALLIPTFCMGGTLPLLGQLVDHGRQRLGLTAGWLYVVNTVGAGLGAIAVPFFLMPQLGLKISVLLGATINGGLAIAAWWLDGKVGAVREISFGAPSGEGRGTSPGRALPKKAATTVAPVLLLALISGIVTFALQVLWNRAFAQVHENSMYSFSVIVAVVIFALAIGAQLARLGLRRGMEPRRLIGGAWMLAGLTVAIGPALFLTLSRGLRYLPTSGGWTDHALHLTGLAAALILAPMALLGIGLPAIMEQAGRTAEEGVGRTLGRLLAVNVAGSVVGALAAGFLLPAWLGLWHSMLWLGALLLAAGLWQAIRWPSAAAHRNFGFVLLAGWIASLFAITPIDFPRVRLASNDNEQLLGLTEGTHGITAVVERPGSRRLKLNNHYGLGGTASTGDERMQAHVPLLLHPAPQRVAFLGLGTGITAGGAMFHPISQITVMELVPEVIAAAREHFREANAGVLDAARTRVVPDDARNFLRGSGEKFDVIIGDLVVPWRQGEGALFTREQFTAARAALAPGGLFCQWLPLFQLSETEVQILARTFLTVFPQAQVWRGDFSPTEPAIALIGTAGDFKLDVDLVQRRLAEMQPDPLNPQLRTPETFWINLVGTLEAADLGAGETRLNTEDRPWIELLGPMLHAGGSQETLFTGRRLQAWLEQVRLRSQPRLGPLPGQEASIVAGSLLAEMTLCLAEENPAGARAAQARLRQTLPAAVYQSMFP